MKKELLFRPVAETLDSLRSRPIPKHRMPLLIDLIEFIKSKVDTRESIRLNFICTHNSRRSHMAQVWAQTAAYFYGIPGVYCYSGGTEATALFPAAAKALERDGFKIQVIASGENPVYAIKSGDNTPPVIGFSKKFDDPYNPQSQFAAIMTCSEADAGCPFVPGTEKRIALTYEDPKAYDHSAEQMEKYLERSRQIAAEMVYVFSNCNSK